MKCFIFATVAFNLLFSAITFSLLTEKYLIPANNLRVGVHISNSISDDVSSKHHLVVFNALGKRSNLLLVEHSRRHIFKAEKWDCIAFMFAKEDHIPNNDTHLQQLRDDQNCTILRMPKLMWGDFLQIITPTFISSYEYITVVLDDIFIPDRGPHAVNADVMIDNMKSYNIQVMSPAVVGDSHNYIGKAKKRHMDNCIAQVDFIETYLQVFTRDAWKCYYQMLHYTGSRGWMYDLKFSDACPHLIFAQDYSMHVWHMDKGLTKIPMNETNSTDLLNWEYESPIMENGYVNVNPKTICSFWEGGCSQEKISNSQTIKKKIVCPPRKNDT